MVFRAAMQREPPQRCCHLQLLFWSDIGGTMPSKNKPFTPSSILFRPHTCRQICAWRHVVEAPGTAPGSEWLIATVIYRHSQNELTGYI
jgi:hypothetical protein